MTIRVNGKEEVVLADQVKSLDWVTRKAKKEGCVEPSVLEEALAKIEALLWQ